MTNAELAAAVRRLYTQGFRDYEIREQLKTCPIFTSHTIADAVAEDTQVEVEHYRNRATRPRKSRPVGNARLVNDDAHYELVDRFN
jgi:transcription elongation GreA/GreB family factor